jgi:hypothetical protein
MALRYSIASRPCGSISKALFASGRSLPACTTATPADQMNRKPARKRAQSLDERCLVV